MSFPSDTKLPLNVMTNKDRTKVLFAEANTDFINVLLSFLALPLGKAVGSHYIPLGSINTLRTSLSCMDESYFCVRGAKNMLLNPRSSLGLNCRTLPIDITYSSPNKYYVCSDPECPECVSGNVSLYSDIARCDCGKWLNKEILVGESLRGGPLITKPSSFIVTDDLRVVPVLTGIFQTLSELGIAEAQGDAEMKSLNMSFGFNEVLKLLKFSFHSSTPLTDMVCTKTGTTSAAVKPDPGITLHHIPKEKLHTRKIALKVFVHKSTDKFLYAEATDEFVELLFNLLVLPLGGVEYLSGGSTCFKSIDNLYGSVANGIGDDCFRTRDTKSSLITPKLPYDCVAKDKFLPLVKDWLYPDLYVTTENGVARIKDTSFHVQRVASCCGVYQFKSIEEGYVKKHSKFIVTEDLSVSPSLSKSILILSSLKIPPSEAKECNFQIGLEEAIGILKASLISKTPLTDVLLNPNLNNLPKMECKPKQEPFAS